MINVDRHIIDKNILMSERIAMKDDNGNCITYNELNDRALRLKERLFERSLVFVLCDHEIDTGEIIFEILLSENVPLLLPLEITDVFLDDLIKKYNPQYLWCSKKKYAANETQGVVIDKKKHNLLKLSNKSYEIHPMLALLLSTSGSTGSSKLVKLSYENLRENAKYAGEAYGIEGHHVGLSNLPLNYTYGFNFRMLHWYCGATVLFSNKSVISKQYSDFFERENVNNFAAVPYTFQIFEKIKFWNNKKIADLNNAMSGGARLSDELQKELIKKLGSKFWIAYGQTECTCFISGINFNTDKIKYGTIGIPFDNMKAFIDDETGELIINSRCVCGGYANSAQELSEMDLENEILHTGDVGYIDEDGCIFLKGRLNRYVKVLGKRISLDELQDVIKKELGYDDIICIGKEDNITVCYIPNYNIPETFEKSVLDFLNVKINIPSKLVNINKIGGIVRSESGKIMYSKIEEMVVMEKEILQICRDISGKEINADEELIESGLLDSFRVIEMISEIEKKYQIEFAPEEMSQLENFSTVRDIIKTIQNKKGM